MGSLSATFSHADNLALEDMHDQLRRVVVHTEHVLDLIETENVAALPKMELSLRSLKAHVVAALGDFRDIAERRAV